MFKIGLIQPKSSEGFWNLSGSLEFTNKKATMPPLGLATVAALTPLGFEVEIVDEHVEEIDFDKKYDMVGITGYTLHSQRMFEISQEFQKRGVLTIGGGPFCSGHREESKPFFDILVCGEVELVWPKFLSDWEKGVHKNFYEGGEGLDVSITPIPQWDSVDLKHYASGIVQTSRGCPYDCEFCDVVSLFGRGNRYKPLDTILTEIKILADLGQFDIFLADDNLIGNRKLVKELLMGLIALNKTRRSPLRYFTQLTLNVAQDLELLDLFKEANFFMFFIGIETPNEESLIATDKKHNIKMDMKESVRRIQSRGIFIFGGMIVGFDTDDANIFRAQSEFLMEAGLTVTSMGILIAYRGTKLWDRLEKEGRLLPPTGKLDMYTYPEQNFSPKGMTAGELKDGFTNLLKTVCRYEHFLKRLQSLIDQVDLKAVKKDSSLARVMGIKYFNLEIQLIALRVIRHYLFTRDKERRKFFLSALWIGLKKGTICLPLVFNTIFFFKTIKEFVDKTYSDSSAKPSMAPTEPQPISAEVF